VSRRRKIVLLVLGVVIFLVVSAVLARILTVDNAEQQAVTALLSDQARGDAAAMIRRIDGCAHSPACQAGVRYNAANLKRPGQVVIVQYLPSSGFSMSSTVGVARVAYTVGSSRPIVQCVRIRRAGNPITGITFQLLVLSRRIYSDADCPTRF
jgi:hypothetical protein